jgi:two-component system response regulator HydG
VGGDEVLKVDVRVIAATNRDLLQAMAAGRFREDLYYRLNVVTLHMSPLRSRREDIPLLAQHFLVHFAGQNHKSIRGFTPQAMDRLLRYAWPGNVRELMNAVERGVVLSRSEYLDEAELPLISASEGATEPLPGVMEDGEAPLEEVEKAAILKSLAAAEGNKSEAARRLGITRRTLHQKLKKWGLM